MSDQPEEVLVTVAVVLLKMKLTKNDNVTKAELKPKEMKLFLSSLLIILPLVVVVTTTTTTMVALTMML